MVFAMKTTENPRGEDLPVEVKCPADTPGANKTFSFTCTKSGLWDFDGGRQTAICMGEGNQALQDWLSFQGPKEVHEITARA
mmetsp:Transcript_35849/g.83424  ORF Transcript_35849/g.83424 Transcript_35849/m.83424 type:complete len:82 (-) Transcript_35849:95-340(-)